MIVRTLLLKKIFPQALWCIPTKEKKIFLTFDDGPHPEATTFVLDELKKINAKATFFCVGENIRKYPEIFNRIITDGHTVGNHTNKHLNGWKTKTGLYLQDIEDCQKIINEVRNTKYEINNDDLKSNPDFAIQNPKLFRPPYGKLTFSQYKRLNKKYKIVMWDVLSKDYDATVSGEKCMRNITSKAISGSVIVMHDNVKAMKNVKYLLPKVLNYYLEQGYGLECI